jgi:carboxypeptidase PM20D1
MFKTTASIACLLFAGSVLAQDRNESYSSDYQREALEMFRHVISLRTAQGHGKVPEMAEYLADKFVEAGFDSEDVTIVPYTGATGEKLASLVVRFRGNGLSGKKPILLLAHMDVVDAIRTDWVRDPYVLIEEDGFFFGRGTSDNKAGIVALTSTFLRLQREGFTPTRDFIIAFSGDEETNMETIQQLVNEHRDLVDAEFVLNSDAGGGYQDHDHESVAYLLQAAEKTYVTYELTVRNPGGHSSLPRADNAIYELATVLKNIEAYRFPSRINEVTEEYFREMSTLVDGRLGEAMGEYAEHPGAESAQATLETHPAEVGNTRTTCIPTMLEAGHAENALPQSATATVNCRIFPGVPEAEVRAQLIRVADNPELEFLMAYPATEGPISALREDVNATVTEAAQRQYGSVPLVPHMSAGATDSQYTRIAGMPSYGVSGIFMRPEDMFAHGLNERIPVKSFYKALDYWHEVLTELGSGSLR